MFLSKRSSAFKISSTITLVVLFCFFYFPLYIWPVTDEMPVQIPVSPPSSSTTKSPSSAAPAATTPSTTGIPEKIWYKLGPRGLTKQAKEWTDSCLTKNPTYKSEFMTDESGDIYVKDKFANRTDIIEAFLALPFPILKADFLRYLLLYNEGGIYSDLDVSCEDIPISEWIPAQYKESANVVVGWEFDVGWGTGFVREFATWTIMAKPNSPHILMVLNDILDGIRQKEKEHNKPIQDLTWTEIGDVVDLTGPRRMTRSILKSLEETLGGKFDENSIAELYDPKLVGDVLVLPGYSFALSSNHYKAEDKQGPALVTHHFDGSWKNDHGGETVDPLP